MSLKQLQELITPAFNTDTLIQIVRKKTDWKDINVENVDISSDSAKKGESYLSTVSRFKIFASGLKEGDGKRSETSIAVIVKAFPSNIARRKTFRSTDFFQNEINFYLKVWEPLLNYVKSKKSSLDIENLLPICLASFSDGFNDFIALEDLTYLGFQGISRSTGLNLEHTKLIARSLAKFHSVSFACKTEKPQYFEELVSFLSETYFDEKFRNWYVPFQKILMKFVRDCVEKQLPEKYVKKFDELIAMDFFKKICELCSKKSKFSVVLHGDTWVPNFLMKYNADGSPFEPALIDFQLARYSSFALDLTFFLYSCTEQTLREQYYEEILKEYHFTFTSVLKELKCDPNLIPYDEFLLEIKNVGLFAIGMSMEAVVMSLIDDDEVANIDEIAGTEAVPLETVWILNPFKTEDKRQRVADIIKHAVDFGLL